MVEYGVGGDEEFVLVSIIGFFGCLRCAINDSIQWEHVSVKSDCVEIDIPKGKADNDLKQLKFKIMFEKGSRH